MIKWIGFLIGGGLVSTLPVILSLWLGIVLFPQFQQLFRQFTWPQAEGVITSSAVALSGDAVVIGALIAPLIAYDVVFLFVSLAIARAVMAPLLRRHRRPEKPTNTTTR